MDAPARHGLRTVDSLNIQGSELVVVSLQRSLARFDESISVTEKTCLVAARQVIELLYGHHGARMGLSALGGVS